MARRGWLLAKEAYALVLSRPNQVSCRTRYLAELDILQN